MLRQVKQARLASYLLVANSVPVELRNRIYALTLDGIIWHITGNGQSSINAPRSDRNDHLDPLRVCRQVHHDIRILPRPLGTFKCEEATYLRHWLAKFLIECRRNIASITLGSHIDLKLPLDPKLEISILLGKGVLGFQDFHAFRKLFKQGTIRSDYEYPKELSEAWKGRHMRGDV